MDFNKPTTLTDSTNNELNNQQPAHGQILSDGTQDRVILGFQKGGFGDNDIGIKVSQDGVDVKTADDDELVMSSAFNMFKIVKIIETNHNATGANYEAFSFAHNLGYIPTLPGYKIPQLQLRNSPDLNNLQVLNA